MNSLGTDDDNDPRLGLYDPTTCFNYIYHQPYSRIGMKLCL